MTTATLTPAMTTINAFQPGRRYAFKIEQEQAWFPDVVEPDFWEMTERAWDYTCCATSALYQVYHAIRYIASNKIKGDVVECGVFLGGSILFAGDVLHAYDKDMDRRLYALDTFNGFVSRIDGVDVDYDDKAVCHARNQHSRSFFEESSANMKATRFDKSRLHIVPGDIAVTIPKMDKRKISLLRLDTDTYESTKLELEMLYPRVSRGGVVIIDDWGFNKGCAQAVREFAEGRMIFPMRQDKFGRSWVKVE